MSAMVTGSKVGGSLTHFVEVEGEPFKAGWCLVIPRVSDEQTGLKRKYW